MAQSPHRRKLVSSLTIVELGLLDLARIMETEKASFIPAIQASKESIRKRFSLGHIMLGAEIAGRLVGKICFSYANFSPNDFAGFPKTFQEFSHQPRPERYNSVFVYNLDVIPEERGSKAASLLIRAMFERAKKDGCIYVVVDGRPSSYNGNVAKEERVKQNPKLKAALDSYLAGGPFPTDEELMTDPTLAFYIRVAGGGKFLWIIPGFLPGDKPAGGIRVIGYKEI